MVVAPHPPHILQPLTNRPRSAAEYVYRFWGLTGRRVVACSYHLCRNRYLYTDLTRITWPHLPFPRPVKRGAHRVPVN